MSSEVSCWHSANEEEVDGHTDADCGEDEAEEESVARDATGLPGAVAELADELDVAEGGGEGDDDAEGDERYSRPKGEASGAGVGGEMRFDGGDLAEKETEAADGEADAHESEASANPGEEGTLGGEVDAGVLLDGLGWSRHGGIVRQSPEGGELWFFGGGLWSSCGDLLRLKSPSG